MTGEPVDFAPIASNVSAPATWNVAGLPAGLDFDQATGRVTGSSSTVGTYLATMTVTDSRAISSAAKTLRLNVLSSTTAANTFPANVTGVTGYADGEEARAVLYAANNTYGSIPPGGTVVLDFGSPVTANSLRWRQGVSNGRFTVRAVDSGEDLLTVTDRSAGTAAAIGNFPYAVSSRTWSITNTGTVSLNLYQAALGYQSTYPATPTFAVSATQNRALNASLTINMSSPSLGTTAGPAEWGNSGLPPGLSQNPTTGVISGTPNTAGTYVARVWMVSSGIHSGSSTITFNIN